MITLLDIKTNWTFSSNFVNRFIHAMKQKIGKGKSGLVSHNYSIVFPKCFINKQNKNTNQCMSNDILHKLWKSLTSNKLELHADNQWLLWLGKKTPLFVSLRHRWQEKTSQLQQSPCFNMSGCSVVFGINFMKWLRQSSVWVADPVLPVLGIVQLTQPWPHQSAACIYNIIYACTFSGLWVSSS